MGSSALGGRCGVDDFQLYLLKTMDPPDQLLAAALDRLRYSRGEMRERYEKISRMTKLISGCVGELKDVLADALVDKAPEGQGEKRRYSLPLWPKYYFGIIFSNQDEFIKQAAFERRLPALDLVDPVGVWDFLVTDLADMFGNIEEIDVWGHYETFLADNLRDGRKYFLRFGWGLLQEIELLNGVNS